MHAGSSGTPGRGRVRLRLRASPHRREGASGSFGPNRRAAPRGAEDGWAADRRYRPRRQQSADRHHRQYGPAAKRGSHRGGSTTSTVTSSPHAGLRNASPPLRIGCWPYLPHHLGPTVADDALAELIAAPKAMRGETVLVVDDDATVPALARECAGRAGLRDAGGGGWRRRLSHPGVQRAFACC